MLVEKIGLYFLWNLLVLWPLSQHITELREPAAVAAFRFDGCFWWKATSQMFAKGECNNNNNKSNACTTFDDYDYNDDDEKKRTRQQMLFLPITIINIINNRVACHQYRNETL